MNHALSGIRNPRHAGVRDQRDSSSVFDFLDKLLRSRCLIVLVIALRRRLDLEVVQQLLGVARVLTGNEVSMAEHAQRPQRDVLQIPDRSRYDVEPRSQCRVGVIIGKQNECSLAGR